MIISWLDGSRAVDRTARVLEAWAAAEPGTPDEGLTAKQEIKAIDEAMTRRDHKFLAQYGGFAELGDGLWNFNAARKPRSRKGSRLTTIRHGGPSGLRIGMRSAERGVNPAVLSVTGGRMHFVTRSEGGCHTIRPKGVTTHYCLISLIRLWLSPVNRPARAERGKKAGTRAPPQKKTGGSCDLG